MRHAKRKKGEDTLPAAKQCKKDSLEQALHAEDAETGSNKEEEDLSSRIIGNRPSSIII